VKYAAERTGLTAGIPRLPLRPVDDTISRAVDAALDEAGLAAQ